MSTISAGNTTTTAIVVTGDTTGNLVFATGGANTVALTIDSTQNITTAKQFSFSSMPTGVVIQAVSATNTSAFSTSSGTFVTTGFSASITPRFSTSKILMMFSVFNMYQGGNMAAAVTVYRGGTALDTNGFAQTYAATGSTITTGAGSGVYLDSPATTNSTTYTLYARNQNNNGTIQINATGIMSMVLLEIAG
jgi:hypothetical protein